MIKYFYRLRRKPACENNDLQVCAHGVEYVKHEKRKNRQNKTAIDERMSIAFENRANPTEVFYDHIGKPNIPRSHDERK